VVNGIPEKLNALEPGKVKATFFLDQCQHCRVVLLGKRQGRFTQLIATIRVTALIQQAGNQHLGSRPMPPSSPAMYIPGMLVWKSGPTWGISTPLTPARHLAPALRKDSLLQGTLAFEMVIDPSGRVIQITLMSSELSDPSLTSKILSRIKLINFGAEDVNSTHVNYVLDFLPYS
jgi:hypothetical protein